MFSKTDMKGTKLEASGGQSYVADLFSSIDEVWFFGFGLVL